MDTDTAPDSETDATDVKYWLAQIADAKEGARKFHADSRDAWDEYLGTKEGKRVESSRSYRYPIFWSSIQTLQPALYSSTPVTLVERRIPGDDPLGRTGSLIAERIAGYLLGCCPFDRVAAATRDDYILSNKATHRVMVDVEQSGRVEIVEIPSPDPTLPPQYIEQPVELAKISIKPVSALDVLHNRKARHWGEIDWLAFPLRPTRREVEEEFGPEIAARISVEHSKRPEPEQETEIEIWEIWDKKTKSVIWVSDCYPEGALKVVPDPYELDDFWPCPPFVLASCPHDSMFPVPDFVQLKPLIEDIHHAWKRVSKLLKSSRVKGVYNANIAELKRLEGADESEYIPVADWQTLINNGGITAAVQHFPTAELVSALQNMIQAMQVLNQFFFEMWGIPDIIRGTSDPVETARAQKIKERYASLRFSSRQRQFQEQIRKTIEMMVDLALAKWDDRYISEVCGYAYMDPEDQERFVSALEMLRNDETRNLRINIETDSTILINEEAQAQKTAEITQTIMSGLSQFASMQQLPPALVAMVGRVIVYSVRGLRDAKSLEDEVMQAINEALQPPPPPEGPPPPDIDQLKLQEDQRQHTVDSQLRQMELDLKQQSLMLQQQKDEAKAGMEAQIRLNEIAIEQQAAATKATIEAARVEVERLKAESQAAQEAARLAFDERTAQMIQMVEMYRLQLEAAQQKIEAANLQSQNYEKLIEEIRLTQSKPKVREADVIRDPLTGLTQRLRLREIEGE